MPRIMLGAALGFVGLLPGCSSLPDSVNPIELYRDVTGASANDPGAEARNQKNLEAGSEKEFPDLGSVPPVPTHALSTEEREALTQKLVADRANAKYTDEELRVGQAASVPPPPRPAAPPPAIREENPGEAKPAAAKAPEPVPPPAPEPAPRAAPVPKVQEKPLSPPSASSSASMDSAPAESTPPKESTLKSPTVGSLPEPQIPNAPPPAPVPAPPAARAPASPAPDQEAAAPAIRAPAPAASGRPVAAIGFASDSVRLPAGAGAQIEQVAVLQRRSGASVRVIGHAAKGKGEGAGQLLSGFKIALDRANAVAEALRDAGVEPDRIYVETAVIGAEKGKAARQTEIFLRD